MYGTQTHFLNLPQVPPFENDVKMYGTQTHPILYGIAILFENDVKMYGTQTNGKGLLDKQSLRMM